MLRQLPQSQLRALAVAVVVKIPSNARLKPPRGASCRGQAKAWRSRSAKIRVPQRHRSLTVRSLGHVAEAVGVVAAEEG